MASWRVRVCVAALLVMIGAASWTTVESRSGERPGLRARRFTQTMIMSDLNDVGGDCDDQCASGGSGSAGRACCNGECVDIARSAQSCGACNVQCAYNRQCCSGVCTNTHAADRLNCGACGHVCADGVPCLFGMCGYSSGRIPGRIIP